MKLFQVLTFAFFLACTLGVSSLVIARQPASPPPADAIYSGGPILTMNDAAPRAEAVAIKDGKIIAVGAAADIAKHRGPQTASIDLAGKTLLPGFIDGHGHVFMTGIQAASANLLPAPDGEGNSIAKIQEILREYAKSDASKAFNIIMGFGYDDAQLAEKRHPTRQDLDEVSKDIPVLLIHQSGHLGALNSKALELAGVTADSKDPQGGVIRREADGKTPSGVLEETAFMGAGMAIFPKLNAEQFAQLSVMGQEYYIKHGFTTAQEGRAIGPAHGSLVRLAEAGQMKIDVVSYLDMIFSDEPPEMNTPWYSRTYRNGYRVGGIKLNLDGSIQGKTGYLTTPYKVPPPGAATNYRGYETLPDKVIAAKVDKAYANGWQVLAHCNGDAAIDQYISAVRDAVAKHGKADRRSVVIHCQYVRMDQLDSIKELGLIPSFFGMHCFYWGDWHRDETLGAARAEKISPAASALKRGIIFSQHHDSPVAQPSAIRILSSVVTRRTRSGDILGADERMSVNDALKSLTIWGAYQHFEEKEKGSLETGKVADFVVLSDDPLKCDIEDLDELTVVETIKGGKSIYKAGPKGAKVGASVPHQLPQLAGVQWDEPATDDASQRPRRGIYAFASVPKACGCAGCTLGHIVTMGRREVATATP
jgi:predicted amidohydrolase YtcJ